MHFALALRSIEGTLDDMKTHARVALVSLAGWSILIGWSSPVRAHSSDPELDSLPHMEGYTAGEATEIDDRHSRLDHLIRRAGQLRTAEGKLLLPPGTRLDRWYLDQSNVAHVLLSFEDGIAREFITPMRLATLEHKVVAILGDRALLTGISIRGRVGRGPYRPLSEFHGERLWDAVQDRAHEEHEVISAPVMHAARNVGARPSAAQPLLGGPSANSPTQPTGALSGVVVFVSAGHGWTSGSSSWFLQRPLLLDMVEDYGNLEQLNAFVHYLYNAGAVVVPFRPVGYQSVEIVIDNDEPEVSYTGAWSDVTIAGVYYDGSTPSTVQYRLSAANPTETATARYTPNLPAADFYPVYCWSRHLDNRVRQTYRIQHSGGVGEVEIDHTRVGNGWIWLGNFYFEAGTGGWVEITNASPDTGQVVADAVRFGNGMGDLVGSGPGTISGFPREEEAARYWAQSEAGVNAVGLSSTIWNCCGADVDDNVSTAARWAREMNRQDVNNQRWRRVYVEFHTNAAGCNPGPTCSAKGTLALAHVSNPTTYQTDLASILGSKVGLDMQAIDDQFEFPWGSRTPLFSGQYGAISTNSNGNEFDATILEVAFHDNPEDAANLRSAEVRDAVARSTMQGVIDFLSDTDLFPDTQVQQIYPPDPPTQLRARHDGNGSIVVSWTPPSSSPAGGDPPLGYRIYRSGNGYGFGQPVTATSIFGQATSKTLNDIPPYTTTYLRVAAYNNGGESLPSEVLAVRRSLTGSSRVLLVDGFDRVSRQQNLVQIIPPGPMERPIPRKVNAFDYVVQHAEALAAAGATFDTAANQNIINGSVALADYETVIWILGEESDDDDTFDATEQTLVTAYLDQGGTLFATGSEIGYELVGLGQGTAFFENELGGDYLGDDANTYDVTGSGGILADVGAFNFDPANGAPYNADSPDRIGPQAGAATVLTYVGGTGDAAGISFDSGTSRAVLFGFPFETITTAATREAIMQSVMQYLVPPPLPGDFDLDGDVDQVDFAHLQRCFTGEDVLLADPGCQDALLDADGDIDGDDWTVFQGCISGSMIPADPACAPF